MFSRKKIVSSLVAMMLGGALMAQTFTPAPRITLDAHHEIGAPKTIRNLTLIPVYAPKAKATDTYMTLDEGMKAKLVKVREVEGGGSVNTLYVTNLGKKPLYIMAGEVVLGGQQDRTLGSDTIIPPTKKEINITAFCVEHGRWSGKADFEASARSVVSLEVRASAQEGGFAASRPAAVSGRVGGQARDVAGLAQQAAPAGQASIAPDNATSYQMVSKSQQEVWDKVARKNAKFKTENATGTYRALLNADGKTASQSLTPYLKAWEGGLDKDPQLVGALVAVNGKVIAADIFGDPTLFRKLWPKLLRSYATDAAESVSKKPFTPITAQMGKSFYLTAGDAKSQTVNKSAVSTTKRLESKTTRLYRLEAAGGGMGGGGVHTSVIGK